MFFAFPIAFAEIRGFNMGITGITFVSIMVSCLLLHGGRFITLMAFFQLGILAAMCLIPYQERIYAKVTKNGTFPEARLYPMMFGALYVFPWIYARLR